MADQEAMDPVQDDDVMTMSTGVRLRLRAPSGMVVNDLLMEAAKIEPKPPTAFNPEKERDEDNPADPDFMREYQVWLANTGVRVFAALVVAGTSIEEPLPDEIGGPDSEDFVDYMAAMGTEPVAGRHQRYLQWVKYVACVDAGDQNEITIRLMRMAGVREEDVGEAQTLFQGLKERHADNGASPQRGAGPRDQVQAPNRRARRRARRA